MHSDLNPRKGRGGAVETNPGKRHSGGGVLRDLVLVATMAVIAVVYLVESLALPDSSPNQADIGPRAYPLLIVALLIVATAVLAVQTVLRSNRRVGMGSDSVGRPPAVARFSLRHSPLTRLLLVLLVTLAYLQLIIWVGFLVATAIYLAIESVVIGGPQRYRGRRAVEPLIYGVLGALAIYLLFEQALGVFLPHGMLGL